MSQMTVFARDCQTRMQWLQLILALSLLVVIHELGHFLFARLFKVRVEKFYMFFNPKFSLIRAKKINGKWQVKVFAPNVEGAVVPVTDEVYRRYRFSVLFSR